MVHEAFCTVSWCFAKCAVFLLRIQELTAQKPAPAGLGSSGIALASDGSVALLSGSPARGSRPAGAYLFSFYTSVGQYNSCRRRSRCLPACQHIM